MRQLSKRILAGVLVLGAAVPAWAQDDDGVEGESLYAPDSEVAAMKAASVVGREGIKQIRLFGGIDLLGVYRGPTFDRVFFRQGTSPVPGPNSAAAVSAPAGGAASPTFDRQKRGRDETFINAVLSIGVEITVNDALSGYFRLETGPADAYGAENSRIGDNNNFARFREGYARVTTKALGIHEDTFDGYLKVGLQNVRFENRRFPDGEGNPFMLDVMNSENPFTGSPGLPASAGGTGRGTAGTASTYYQTFARGNTWAGGNAFLNNYIGQPKEQEAGGAVFGAALVRDLRSTLNLDVSLGAMTLLETGTAHADTEVAFANIDIAFGKPNYERDLPDHHSKFNILAVGFSNAGAYVGSVGGGATLFLFDNLLEVFGEGQYQRGILYSPSVATSSATGARAVRHESWGGYGGMRLQFPWTKHKFYIEASYWFLMGDDGSETRSATYPGTTTNRPARNHDFMSMENNNDTLIVEGSQAGLDLDSNYQAYKVQLGVTMWEMFDLKIVGGMFTLVHPPSAQSHEWGTLVAPARVSSAAALATYEFDDNLGIEVDVRVSWRPSDTFSLYAVYGTLFGSDFLKDIYEISSMHAGGIGAKIRF